MIKEVYEPKQGESPAPSHMKIGNKDSICASKESPTFDKGLEKRMGETALRERS